MKKPCSKRLLFVLVAATLLVGLCLGLYVMFEPDIDQALYPREYCDFVEQYATTYDVPVNLVYAVIRTESGFDPGAVSSVGAVGLMQMMPSTFRWLTDDMLGEGLADEMLYDAETNIRYCVYYLRRLYDRYGDWLTACAAYNAGSGRVDSWLDDPTMVDPFGNLIESRIPFDETRAYVRKIQKAYTAYERLYPTGVALPFL
jgi:soluble lytic murein transglycosylase